MKLLKKDIYVPVSVEIEKPKVLSDFVGINHKNELHTYLCKNGTFDIKNN